MRIFEKLAEYRYEQMVFCHDKPTGKDHHHPQYDAGHGLG
jgi:hypothetical protein